MPGTGPAHGISRAWGSSSSLQRDRGFKHMVPALPFPKRGGLGHWPPVCGQCSLSMAQSCSLSRHLALQQAWRMSTCSPRPGAVTRDGHMHPRERPPSPELVALVPSTVQNFAQNEEEIQTMNCYCPSLGLCPRWAGWPSEGGLPARQSRVVSVAPTAATPAAFTCRQAFLNQTCLPRALLGVEV